MKKFLISLIIVTSTILNASDYKTNLLSIFHLKSEIKKPQWIKNDPDNTSKYFRGYSAWYVTDDYRMKELANKDALKNAYMQVANYFGVKIQSEIDINQTIKGNYIYKEMSRNINLKTTQFIFDVKPYKLYKEFSKDKKYFRIIVLLKLDPKTEQEIKEKITKDKKEFLKLKKKLIIALQNRDFYNAQIFLDEAKGKMAATFDNSIPILEKRLQKLKEGQLVATIILNKKRYIPDEDIKLEVSMNKEGYLYIFYDTGDDIEMLFPNEFHRNPKVNKNDTISFPTDDVSLTAYKESLGKKTKIVAIASKKNLNIFRDAVDKIDGIYIYDRYGKQSKKIKKCIKQSECRKSEMKFKVSNQPASKIEIQYKCNPELSNKIKKIFLSNGIKSQRNDEKIVFSIKKEKIYSNNVDEYITHYNIDAKLYKKNHLIASKQLETDESSFNNEIVETYLDLISNLN